MRGMKKAPSERGKGQKHCSKELRKIVKEMPLKQRRTFKDLSVATGVPESSLRNDKRRKCFQEDDILPEANSN